MRGQSSDLEETLRLVFMFPGNDVPCNDTAACPDGTTCCKTKEGGWACCPLPEVQFILDCPNFDVKVVAANALMSFPFSHCVILRLFAVQISFTAAQKVRRATWLPRPATTPRAPCRGPRRYPQSPGRSHRWRMLRVTPLPVVLMAPPAARQQQESGPAVP